MCEGGGGYVCVCRGGGGGVRAAIGKKADKLNWRWGSG